MSHPVLSLDLSVKIGPMKLGAFVRLTLAVLASLPLIADAQTPIFQNINDSTFYVAQDGDLVMGALPSTLRLKGSLNAVAADSPIFPGKAWEMRSPEEAGLSREKLMALATLAGGRGCVVRHGYMVFAWGDQSKSSDVASAFKPLLTTLLFMAVQDGRIGSVDDEVAEFEPRLKALNAGKDAAITWRHFAFQMSGYGLAEAPGAAYSYNDYALALYYDTLTQKVFGTNGTALLRTRLAEPMQFEDACTFDAFGPQNRPGRLALSVRDFARFGLLYLRQGRWRDQQLLRPEFVQMATRSPLAPATPLTSGQPADMLPGQRTIGGTRNITPVGPGYYSFNWWLNGKNGAGQRLFGDASPDTYVASGHGGMRMLWIIPSLDLVVCPNTAISHLAGALGRPVFLALPRAGDWRWLLGRDDTPWYPTMRLFRQTTSGDWSDVIARMTHAIQERAAPK